MVLVDQRIAPQTRVDANQRVHICGGARLRSSEDGAVTLNPRKLLLASVAALVGCDAERTFDPTPFVGTWRGRWIDDAGRRGSVELRVREERGAMHLACDVLGGAIPGVRIDTEHIEAQIDGDAARVEGHRSPVFGDVTGVLQAGGDLALDCRGVRGAVDDLHAQGAWTEDAVSLEVDVTFDSGLRTTRAVVELERALRD